jgi:hypothetical protein
MSHKLAHSEYIFTKKFFDKQARPCTATVTLRVNHNDGSYIVLPSGTAKNEFGFVSNSKHNYELWKVILELIDNAVEYGESLVTPTTSLDEMLVETDEE